MTVEWFTIEAGIAHQIGDERESIILPLTLDSGMQIVDATERITDVLGLRIGV